MGDSNSRPDGPKPMSKPSGRTVSHSLALSGTPAVPLWNSIGLFISATAFGFWDLCGIEFCILKVLPTGFTSNSGCFLPQRAAQKLRRINKEISAGVILPTLSINGKCVVVAKTPSENVQTKKKTRSFFVISPSSTVIQIVWNNRKCIVPNDAVLFRTIQIYYSEQFHFANILSFSVAISCFL